MSSSRDISLSLSLSLSFLLICHWILEAVGSGSFGGIGVGNRSSGGGYMISGMHAS